MHRGYVKIWRKILDWQWINSPNHLSVLITLVINANHKKTKWRNEIIEPGQILTGRKQLSNWSGVSESTVYRVLKDLENSKEVNIKKCNKYSIITLINWSEYQQGEQQMNNKRTTNEQQMDTSKNVKNVKNVKNIIHTCQVEEVFNYFVAKCKKPQTFKLNESRKKIIETRLKEYSLEDIKTAIDNFSKDDWPERKKFNDIVYVIGIRNKIDNLEKWINLKMEGQNGNSQKRFNGNNGKHKNSYDNKDYYAGAPKGFFQND